ncbi:hypothetical protein [Peribacillus sp. FSL E2-0218]|uniref:hypothetical protein n=1 Tax=Peribacillus sp. FSL E2-0218 TaxID=2921364 RepID=UPI0030ED9AF9
MKTGKNAGEYYFFAGSVGEMGLGVITSASQGPGFLFCKKCKAPEEAGCLRKMMIVLLGA